MKRYAAGFAGLFSFMNIVGCAAPAEQADEPATSEQAVKAADIQADQLPSAFERSTGPTCLAGKYTSQSSWTEVELLPNGQGFKTERLHDGEQAKIAQGRFFWSATDRTISIGMHEHAMRVEADCRFVWIGDAMFTRTP